MKEKEELKKEIEAVLFAAGRKIGLDELAKLCKAEKNEVDAAVKELKQDYENNSSPLLLTEEADGYKLTVREKYLSIVKEVAPHTELNRAMMETLAVIAWKHPALQSDVIKIRTSKAYEDVKNLVDMGFVSKEKHGRSFILKATGKFFEYFDLPDKEAVKEIFKDVKDVEPETQEKLDNLEVYESVEKKEEKEEADGGEESEPKEKLGNLEVFKEDEADEEGEGDGEELEEHEEIGEKSLKEKEETGHDEIGDEQEEDEEEKARRTLHRLAGEDLEEDKDDGKSKEEKEEQEEEKPKKKRLPKELEEFAGIEDEEENKKNKED